MKLLGKCVLFLSILYTVYGILNTSKVFAASSTGVPISAYYFNYWGTPFGGRTDVGLNYWSVWDFQEYYPKPDPNLLVSGSTWRRQITSGDGKTYPYIGPYDNSNSDVVSWQVGNAKNSGIDAFAIFLFGNDYNKTLRSSDDTTERSRMWWTTGHVTIPTIEKDPTFKFYIGQDWFPVSSTCDYATTRCDGYVLADFPSNVAAALQQNSLTQQRFADVVINAYAALSSWKNSPKYMRLDGKPVYFFAELESFRDNPAKLNSAFRAVEQLIGEPVYWFGYDGMVVWGTGAAATNTWKNPDGSKIVSGFVDGWGFSKGIAYGDDANYTNTRSNVNFNGNAITSTGFDWIPNIQTSYDDTFIRLRCTTTRNIPAGCATLSDADYAANRDSPINANTRPWLKRNNGETFKKSLITNRDSTYPKKMYFLSSWNATPLEGYSVEPAITWGNDTSTDPYQYLKILSTNLTGTNFNPAPLPSSTSIDPLIISQLPYASLPGDVNRDGKINILDLARIINKRTSSSVSVQPGTSEDLNSDNAVNGLDLTIFWGYYTHL